MAAPLAAALIALHLSPTLAALGSAAREEAPMQYPNEIQAALLFDKPVAGLEEVVRTFMRIEAATSGASFNIPESKAGTFYRLYGGDQLMITLEYLDTPAAPEVFQQALASTITGLLCPDARQRIMRNRSHILINVSHGVLGGVAHDPRIAGFLQQVGIREGHSLAQFRRRLEVLALLARMVGDLEVPQLVHWTQSNQIIPGERFDDFAAAPAPSPLHVHAYLFGDAGTGAVGIRTFGAGHFIGREVIVEPSTIPWSANFETILSFLRIATMEGGYIIPDGDSFGPEDGSLSYRALHRAAEADEVALIELVPLLHREHGFQSPDYVPRDRAFDDRSPPAELMPADAGERDALSAEWRDKRAMAERIGGGLQVRVRDTPPAPPSPPTRPGFGRKVFGRKPVG
jgi:hypothetical protein